MHPQLEALLAEFDAGTERLHRLASAIPDDRWWERPSQDRWSAGECVAHLNLTAGAFKPHVAEALEEARRLPRAAPGRYTRGLVGGLLWRVLGRMGRFRVKTRPGFVPAPTTSRQATIEKFDRLQAEQIGWVRAADGLPLTRVRILSPFDGRVRYNLFAGLSILARHQQRHLWQAEQAWQQIGGPHP